MLLLLPHMQTDQRGSGIGELPVELLVQVLEKLEEQRNVLQ